MDDDIFKTARAKLMAGGSVRFTYSDDTAERAEQVINALLKSLALVSRSKTLGANRLG